MRWSISLPPYSFSQDITDTHLRPYRPSSRSQVIIFFIPPCWETRICVGDRQRSVLATCTTTTSWCCIDSALLTYRIISGCRFFFCMSGRTGADVSTSPAIHQLSIWWWVFIVYPIRKLVLRENYAWGAGTSRKWFDMSWPPASTRLYTLLHKIAVSGKLLSPPAFRLGARNGRRRGVASPLTRFPSSKICSLWQAQ